VKATASPGTTKKHAGTYKHSGTKKHSPTYKTSRRTVKVGGATVTVTVKTPTHPKARGLAIGEAWDCCAAEAVGASLRLAGHRVSEDDVLALHLAAGGSEDAGVPIVAALEAASEFGLAGVRPVTWECVNPAYKISGFDTPLILGVELPGPHAVLAEAGHWWSWGTRWPVSAFPSAVVEEVMPSGQCRPTWTRSTVDSVTRAGLILGVELPGAHAVTSSGGHWWSWGTRWAPEDFRAAVVEEAWAVVWS
jgi:hypothetical protein